MEPSVAFGGALHAAHDVTKTHTSALETFASPDTGPVASFHPGAVWFFREPGRRCVRVPVREPTARVEVVPSGIGAIAGGDIPAQKARLTLALALTAVDDPMDTARYFE